MTGFAHGLVIGKFYPPHAGHVHLVRTALSRCERVTVQVLASSRESIPAATRAAWLRAETPGAHVVHGLDDAPVNYADPHAWDAHVTVMRALLDPAHPPVDAVLTSDRYGAELARRFDATWVQVDPDRRHLPVSGTAVRADPAGHWWALPAPVRSWYGRRVVVLGAESTGTTTLATDLAARLGLDAVPEFGREWSRDRPGGLAAPWHTAEFDLVAREQARREDHAATTSPVPLLVSDTDVLATTLWHERYVGRRSPSVEALAAARRPDLYVLTGDEIPFVQDGLRDGEHVRHAMQDRFRVVLAATGPHLDDPADVVHHLGAAELPGPDGTLPGVPWFEVRGDRATRVAQAMAAVGPLLATPRHVADPLPQAGTDAW
ncbi:AAA family ATPase [Cellulosimicrobium marinum]|uniref:AAA family ATPase n=1 Tax=Cellulosimicrobium marinum TaxID=1638992 RepID=UPI001E47EFCE|nr:AAA family ATPase [Cellulosimicrobium marinum]MCB7136323.1 AAA family ATPase [Cellulosimicrobium marinum]